MTTGTPSLEGQSWLEAPSTQRVLAVLAEAGYEGRAVGGVVRNGLMGLAVTDIDIATTARPEEVSRIAKAAGMAVVETGLKHGTVTVIADHHPFEVTTLRRDVETHGRHATVAFTDDWAEDARRRDFTMNALYCDAAGRVHDPLGGLDDVMARRVRFIGDAGERIREDFLRILRFFRFTAQYSDEAPDVIGLAAATRERIGLGSLSAERIRQEMVRILTARRAQMAVEAMQAHGILAEVLPAAPRPGLLARVIEIERANGLEATAMPRLAAMAVEVPEDAMRLSARLRLSREETGVLRHLAETASRLAAPPTPRVCRALLYRLGVHGYRQIIVASWARALAAAANDSSWSDALSLPLRWTAPTFPVRGADIMAASGLPPGAQIGEAMRRLEAHWIEEDFAPTREALLLLVGNR